MQDNLVSPEFFADEKTLRDDGFEGFVSVETLKSSTTSFIPSSSGVYLVIDPIRSPSFILPGSGGYFQGKDPNVSLSRLNEKYVDDTVVLYIGKANDLQQRIRQYISFGRGQPVAHYGGRLIWQLEYHDKLIFCWKRCETPRDEEKRLLKSFKDIYGQLPFANLCL